MSNVNQTYLRVAYADPPYPGVAHRYPEKREVDHAELIGQLVRDFPDGWALSTKSGALRDLLPLCPPRARVAAWVKTLSQPKPTVRPPYAWEPVIFIGGRFRRHDLTPDWFLSRPYREQAVLGAKPVEFCHWLFRMLGLEAGDELVDLFPGSGAVTDAWDGYQRQLVIV